MLTYKELLDNPTNTYAAQGNALVNLCAGIAKESGWDSKPVDVPCALMLTVSELAEGMEGHRKDLMDDKLKHHPMLHVELADAVIRIFHLAGRLNVPLGDVIVEKLHFNTRRIDHTPEHRASAGGKKY